jgi:hypothetical protein
MKPMLGLNVPLENSVGALRRMKFQVDILRRWKECCREYDRRDPLRWPRDTLYPQKLALTSPTSDGRSVDIVRLRTKATEKEIIV